MDRKTAPGCIHAPADVAVVLVGQILEMNEDLVAAEPIACMNAGQHIPVDLREERGVVASLSQVRP